MTLNPDANLVRLLGGAQLVVFLLSALNERLLALSVGSATGSDILVSISNNLARFKLSSLLAIITSFSIIVLGGLFYAVFREEYPVIALIALACFLAESVILAVSKLGASALIPLSQDFIQSGTQESASYQSLADTLYHGIDRRGYDLHMVFFCLGATLWYYLLYISGAVPRALALWGLIAVVLLTIPVLMIQYDRDLKALLFLGLAYAPYELVLGIWLLLKGFK